MVYGGGVVTGRMTGDEYMAELKRRADAWADENGGRKTGFPPLLEWFIRDEDVDLVDLPPDPEIPKRVRQPRHYRPASYWRPRVEKMRAELARLSAPILPERAAATGEALGRSRTLKVAAQMDRRLQRYVEMEKRLRHAEHMLRSAEMREAS